MKCAVAVLALLAALGARAAVRLDVKPAFPAVGAFDVVVLHVEIANDETARDVVLRASTPGQPNAPSTELATRLAPNARKAFDLRRLPFRGGTTLVELKDGDEVLAQGVARVERLHAMQHLVGVLGPVPPGLSELTKSVRWLIALEVDASRLPEDELDWPSFDAVIWPEPRSTSLAPEPAAALARWVHEGGLLVAGVDEGEPRALEALGIVAKDATWSGEPLVPLGETTSGLGTVRRILETSAALRQRDAAGWASLGIGAMPTAVPDRPATRTGLMELASWVFPPMQAPRAPVAPAACILALFLVVIGPGEAWLRRRALRRGRPARRAAARHFAAVALATSAAFLVARGSESEGRVARLDIVDLDATSGIGAALSFGLLDRARDGRVELVAAPGVTMADGGAFGQSWQQRERRFASPALLQAESTRASERMTVALGSWQPAATVARWRVAERDAPHLELREGTIEVQGALGAVLAENDERAEWRRNFGVKCPLELDAERRSRALAPDESRGARFACVLGANSLRAPRLSDDSENQVLLLIGLRPDAPAISPRGFATPRETITVWRVALPPLPDGRKWKVAP